MILGELVAQALEAEGGVRSIRKLNLGGTFVCDTGFARGDLDAYVDTPAPRYRPCSTKTCRGIRSRRSSGRVSSTPRRQVTLMEPLGFNNTFTILVRGARRASAI